MQAAAREALQPADFRLGHRRWLDGLRGVAILLVLAFHLNLGLTGGFLGVDLFFVISGFLITSLLLEEHAATGTIRLSRFYMRRALRLLPALLVLVLGLLVWAALARPNELKALQREAVVALCFATNMVGRLHQVPMSNLHFTWSLSVEEQFYFVWPAVLLTLLWFRAPKLLLAGILATGIVAIALLRAHQYRALPPQTDPFWFVRLWSLCAAPETRGDGLLCGCLAAVLASWGVRVRTPAARRLFQCVAFLAAVLLAGCAYRIALTDPYCFRGLFSAFTLSAAALIVCTLTAPFPPLCRVLEWSPLVGAGRISYGLFLFHLPVVTMLGIDPTHLGLAWPVNSALVIAVSVLAAVVSFHAIQRPVLRLKNRFAFPKIANAPAAAPAAGQQQPSRRAA